MGWSVTAFHAKKKKRSISERNNKKETKKIKIIIMIIIICEKTAKTLRSNVNLEKNKNEMKWISEA